MKCLSSLGGVGRILIIFPLLSLTIGSNIVFGTAYVGASESRQAPVPPDVEITMSPTSSRLSIEGGESRKGVFTVLNSGKKDFTFRVYAAPYTVTNEQYDPVFGNYTNRTQIARWVSFDKTEYSIKSGESIDVDYRVEVPADIPDGGQYAVLFAETTGDEGNVAQSAVVSKKRVGMLLYAKSNGNTREQGELLEVRIPFWQMNAPFHAGSRVGNGGNTDFTVASKLRVESLFGALLYESNIVEHTVLPDTTRSITAEWQSPRAGIYKVSLETKYLDNSSAESRLVIYAPIGLLLGLAACFVGVSGVIIHAVLHKRQKRKRPQDAKAGES